MRQQRSAARARRAGRALILAAAMLAGVPAGALPDDGDLFDEIFAESAPLRASLETLTARITETTTSALLARPLVEEGTVILVRPSRVWLQYTAPDARTITVDDTRLTVAWPARDLHETRDIRAAQRRVHQYFVDATPDELRRHFRIDAAVAADRADTYLVTMEPTRPQIQQGLAKLELWVDRASLLPAAMRLTFPGGETKQLEFEDVRVNPPLEWPGEAGGQPGPAPRTGGGDQAQRGDGRR